MAFQQVLTVHDPETPWHLQEVCRLVLATWRGLAIMMPFFLLGVTKLYVDGRLLFPGDWSRCQNVATTSMLCEQTGAIVFHEKKGNKKIT